VVNVRWSDRSIGSIGQACLRSDKNFTDGEEIFICADIIIIIKINVSPKRVFQNPFTKLFHKNYNFNIFTISTKLKIKNACMISKHRIKISNRRATQRCNVSAFFNAKICSLLARRRSSQLVQRVYWPENVIDWLGKWRPTCIMRHARGQKLQSFQRKWPFHMELYSMIQVFSSLK
jgi:hypothetical protein